MSTCLGFEFDPICHVILGVQPFTEESPAKEENIFCARFVFCSLILMNTRLRLE